MEQRQGAGGGLKKVYEGTVIELWQLIQRRRMNRGKTPEKTLFTGVAEGEIVDAEFQVDGVIEELWRDYPLERWTAFGLSPKQVEKLQAAGVATVGELAQYTMPNAAGYCKKLTDIAGVGRALAEKIEEANTAFWAEWNRCLKEKFAEEKGVGFETGLPQTKRECHVKDSGNEPASALPCGDAPASGGSDQSGADAECADQDS